MSQVIGLDDVEEIMNEFGISGDADVVGEDAPGAQLMSRMRAAARAGVNRRVLVPNGVDGRQREFPLGFTAATVADAASGSLTATPDRACAVRGLHVQANSVAGALLYGFHVTTITVQGRNARVGNGLIPDFALRTWALMAMKSLSLGMVTANGTIALGVTNEAGATVDSYAGAIAETVD